MEIDFTEVLVLCLCPIRVEQERVCVSNQMGLALLQQGAP